MEGFSCEEEKVQKWPNLNVSLFLLFKSERSKENYLAK